MWVWRLLIAGCFVGFGLCSLGGFIVVIWFLGGCLQWLRGFWCYAFACRFDCGDGVLVAVACLRGFWV